MSFHVVGRTGRGPTPRPAGRLAVVLTAAGVIGGLLTAPRGASADEADRIQRAVEAFELIRAWRVEEARPIVAELVQEAPEDPRIQAVAGQLDLHLGDYEEAVAYFTAAREGGAPPGLLVDARAAEQAKVATEGYVEHLFPHFVIRHPPGKDAMIVPFAEDALDEARARIGELLGYKPQERVVVELYPTAKTLAAVSALTPEDIETSGTIALCRWNRLMATTPRAVVFGYAWRDTLAHELAHLIIGGASKNTAPIWLHEGLAKYVETAWRAEPGMGVSVEQQRKLRDAAKKKTLITFEQMHPSMAKLPSQEAASLAFTEVFTFVEFLVAEKGWPGIRALLRAMADGADVSEGLEAVYGAPLPELERRWKRTLPRRPIRRSADGRPIKGDRRLRLKGAADTPDDELEGLGPLARRYARAADLLFARGRFRAAQLELEKAFDESRSPLVSAKLATLALANEDLERAEAAARRSIEERPGLAGPNVTLAEILLRQGKTEAMWLPLERAIDVNPFDPRIHELSLRAAGEDAASERARRAREALAWSTGRRRAPDVDPGRGATLRVEGRPFSRIYLERDGRRWATRRTTPSRDIEVAPGEWSVVIVPPKGPPATEAISVSEGGRAVVRFAAPAGGAR